MRLQGESKRKALKIAGDSVWSIAGLVLMNVVAQFVIYPIWNRELGNEIYGQILYLLSGMNILAVSFGMACNYARMKLSVDHPTHNRMYLVLLSGASVAAVPYILLYAYISGSAGFFSTTEMALLAVLTVVTMWRYYADVEYRLNLNYRQFFVYYLVISIGYGIGGILFRVTGLWPLGLLVGEAAGLVMVAIRGRVLRPEPKGTVREDRRLIIRTVAVLLATDIISNLVFNGDRVLLNLLIGGTAVTIYYQASLLGKTMALITTPLNSVLIGYLAKSKAEFSFRMMNIVSLLAAGTFILFTGAITLASHVLIQILYPQNYELVRGYFLVANAAQVAYFIANVAITILLRYCKMRYQLYVNVIYAVLFVALCIPAAVLWGLDGFCWALLIVCVMRVVVPLFLGYRHLMLERRKADEH